MNQQQIELLYQKFATPLIYQMGDSAPKEAVEMLAKNLWAALILGPPVEEAVWKTLAGSIRLEPGLIEALQRCYHEQMKPFVSEEELAALRERYRDGDNRNKETL